MGSRPRKALNDSMAGRLPPASRMAWRYFRPVSRLCWPSGVTVSSKAAYASAASTSAHYPIVTPMANIAFALKTKNAIIVAPHPKAKNCSTYTVNKIIECLRNYNVPEGLIQIIEEPSIEKTQELMASVDVVVATGGMQMVHSAYSSSKPSFGSAEIGRASCRERV